MGMVHSLAAMQIANPLLLSYDREERKKQEQLIKQANAYLSYIKKRGTVLHDFCYRVLIVLVSPVIVDRKFSAVEKGSCQRADAYESDNEPFPFQ